MSKVEINAEVKSNVGEVGAGATAAAGSFSVMGVSVNSVTKGIKSMAVMAKASFATMKAAMISTGIGALLIAVTSLISFFKNTQKGAEMLERAMAGMGAVVGEVSDLFAKVGETMVNAFQDPQKAVKSLFEAIKKNLMNRITGFIDQFGALGKVIKSTLSLDWEGVKEGAKDFSGALTQVATGMDEVQRKNFVDGLKAIGKEMDEDVKAAMRLKGVMQGIRREEMEFTKEQAQTRQDVAKARLLAMDESKTQEERLEAINSVMKSELEMTANIIEMQKKKVEAKREELTLNKTMIEDEEELAALEVQLIDLTTKSTMTQKRLMLEVETLTNEMNADRKTKEKARLKSAKQDADALAKYNLTRLKDETDEAFKIRMDAAAEEQKQALISAKVLAALSKENMLAAIDNDKERALKKLEIEHEAKLEELKDHENFAQLKIELDKKYTRDKEKVDTDAAKKTKDLDAAVLAAKRNQGIKALQLVEQLAGEGSEIGKAAAVASATISGIEGVQNAFTTASKSPITTVFPAYPFVQAGLAGAFSAMQIQKILSGGKPEASGGGGGSAGATPQTPAPQMMSGSFELGGGVAPEPLKAFVVTDEMTSSQDQLANIRRRATI